MSIPEPNSNDQSGDLLFVSIIIPCRNEENFIGLCLDSVISNDYPKHRLEVLIVDGMSEDGTREITEGYAKQYPFIGLLSNDKRITPVALNMGLKYARSGIIMRMDAHAVYEKDYISKCVKYLVEYGCDNVGGIVKTIPRDNTFIGKIIVLALSHRFGVGNSVFRTGSKEPKWVDTVFGGCYRREVFDRIGLFNENLARTQDIEFNLRLKRTGGKTLLHPEIVSHYYAISDLKSFCRSNLSNGFWAIYPLRFVKHMPVSWRHMVPLVFVSSLVASVALSVFSQLFLWFFLFIVGSYGLAAIYFSIKIAAKEKNFRYLCAMPLAFATLHIGYGLGSLWGLLRVVASAQFWKNRLSFLGDK